MSNDLKVTLENINQRLLNIDKVAREQEEELKEFRRILKEIYEELYKKKQTIDKYKRVCSKVVSTTQLKNTRSRDNE